MSSAIVPIQKSLNWIHYSSSSTQIVMLTNYKQGDVDGFGIFSKPKGLWITPENVDNNWYDWCMGEEFRTAELNFIYDVKIKSNANLLLINNAAEMDAFTSMYGYSYLTLRLPRSENTKDQAFRDSRMDAIRWEKVAEKFQGILIPRYIGERRLMAGCDWYYPWDCASGCIWSSDAIESITLRSTVSAGHVSKPIPRMSVLFEKAKDLLAQQEKAAQSVARQKADELSLDSLDRANSDSGSGSPDKQ